MNIQENQPSGIFDLQGAYEFLEAAFQGGAAAVHSRVFDSLKGPAAMLAVLFAMQTELQDRLRAEGLPLEPWRELADPLNDSYHYEVQPEVEAVIGAILNRFPWYERVLEWWSKKVRFWTFSAEDAVLLAHLSVSDAEIADLLSRARQANQAFVECAPPDDRDLGAHPPDGNQGAGAEVNDHGPWFDPLEPPLDWEWVLLKALAELPLGTCLKGRELTARLRGTGKDVSEGYVRQKFVPKYKKCLDLGNAKGRGYFLREPSKARVKANLPK